MDGGNWRPAQQEAAEPDWRLQLSLDSRNRIVNKILDTLKKHLPISGPDGLGELQKIAVRFEEKIYAAATSQTDYLRRISVKMLTMETKSQSGVANSSSMGGQIPSDPGSNSMQSQMRNQGQQQLPMRMVKQSQTHAQMLPQNSIPLAGGQNSASLSATMYSMTGLTQTGMTNVAGQNANLSSNMGGVPQNSNSNSLVGQGVQPNAFANAKRQQQLQGSQQQSQNSQQQYSMYQLRNQFLKQKIQQQQQQQQSQQHQGNMQSSMLHTHLQQQQQQQSSLLQSNQLQASQQSLMQMASGHPSTQALQQPSPSMMQIVPESGLQQNQQAQSVLHQHQQSFMRQQQQTQQSSAHHQQQSQLIGQQPNTHGIQQMLGQQQTGVQDMQQQQQQSLLGSPGNLANIQQPLQPSIHGQRSSISTLTQQQQLSGQNNLAGGQQQQQQLSHQGNLSNIQLHQNSMHMMQQAKSAASQQQSNQQAPSAVLPSQGQQQSQTLSHQQQLMSQFQSQSLQLPQQMALQQQQPQANSIAMQPRMQRQSNLLQAQNNIEQQKLLFQAQRGLQEASSTSLDTTAQTGLPSDWQEEAYQKLKVMKEMYYTDLSDLFNKITSRYQMHDAQAQGKQTEQMDKLKMFRNILERLLHCLNLPKSGILPGFKEKLLVYEKQIINILSSHRIKKPPLHQQAPGVIPLSSMPQQPMVQMSQLQQHDNLVNPMQPMSIQSSATTSMSTPLTTNMGAPHAQQGMLNSVQPAQNLDQTHGNAMSPSLQNMMVSLQQSSLMVAQQGGMSTIPQGVNLLQPNMNSLQSNPTIIQHQQLKQQQDQHKHQQQLMQNQQLKPQFSQQPMQPQMIQQQQKQILMQKQLQQQQQQQLMQNQQLKQQFSQRHMQSQIIQQQQKQILMQKQLQQQQLIQQIQPKQVPSVLVQSNALAIDTPGMSASPLLAEFTGVDGSQVHAAVGGKASATERPLNRLLKSVRLLFFNCCLGD